MPTIEQLLKSYNKTKERNRRNYLKQKETNPDFDENNRIRQRKFYQENKEKLIIRSRNNRIVFKEKIKAKQKEGYQKNKDKFAQRYEDNKEKILLQKKERYDFLISWGAGKTKNFANDLLLIDLDIFN